MSEDTSDGFADQPRSMVLCRGCGFHVEHEDVRATIFGGPHEGWYCEACVKCEACPDMRESYRRGFEAGVEALRQCVVQMVTNFPRRS